MKKVTSILVSALLFYSLTSNAKASEASTVVLFGDSNTEGSNWIENSYDHASKWSNKLTGNVIINAGMGGDTIIEGKNRFQIDVLRHKPETVTIMFGTNDATLLPNGQPKVSKQQFEQTLNYFVDTLQQRKVKVVLMTTIPIIQAKYYERHPVRLYIDKKGARQWHDSYNSITRKVARQQKVTLIDNYANVIRAAGGAEDSKLTRSGLIDPSGTHFTPKGAGVVYDGVRQVIEQSI
jgi:lysophospholipase L1-like esterase